MKLNIYTTAELTPELKDTFNLIWSAAREKDENIFEQGNTKPQDLYFFLQDLRSGKTVSVGRYRFVKGIKIGNKLWETTIWGRASISTDPQYQGKGYGKELVTKMDNYALKHKLWVIGFHGKKGTLSEFYKKCGLEVDSNIGLKMYYPKDGEQVQHVKVAVSYFKGDPFVEAVRKTKEKVYLPYSW